MNARELILSIATCLVISVLGMSKPSFAQQEDEPLKDHLYSVIKHDPFSVSVLVQSTFRYSFEDNQFNGGRRFGVDNANLVIEGDLDASFYYRLNLSIARQISLWDGYMTYKHRESLNIRAGSQKQGMSAEAALNPGDTDMIDRARLVGVQLNPRDFGVNVFGDMSAFNYSIGLYNGTGLSQNIDNRFWLAARGGYDFLHDQEGSFDVGVNFAYGECLATACSPSGLEADGTRMTYGGDFRYENSRWLFSGELLATRADVMNYFTGQETVYGAHLTGGFMTGERTMLLARWDHLGYRESGISNNMLFLGLNHQITSVVKFQFNLLTLFDPDSDDEMGLSANLQVMF